MQDALVSLHQGHALAIRGCPDRAGFVAYRLIEREAAVGHSPRLPPTVRVAAAALADFTESFPTMGRYFSVSWAGGRSDSG
jgi:hypothetical protein